MSNTKRSYVNELAIRETLDNLFNSRYGHTSDIDSIRISKNIVNIDWLVAPSDLDADVVEKVVLFLSEEFDTVNQYVMTMVPLKDYQGNSTK